MSKKSAISEKRLLPVHSLVTVLKRLRSGLRQRTDTFLARRPHRSFRRTRRRDYERSLQLPGYIALTRSVGSIVWRYRKPFVGLVIIYAVLTAVFVGLASQTTYTELSDTLRQTGGDIFKGNSGAIGQAALLLASGMLGNFGSSSLSSQNSIYGSLIALLIWLTTVWLLRGFMAGQRPKLRDGLYNAGAPIISSLFVSLLLVVQLLPVAVVALGYSAATSSGLLTNGVESMLFWATAGLLTALSLYWLTSTMFALIVVTLPGMYPAAAIKTAGDLVTGRRTRILLRFLWLILIIVLAWVVIMIPIILFDTWLKGVAPAIQWLPLVPLALLLMSSLTIVWSAAYTYVFYRKVVDDDARPA